MAGRTWADVRRDRVRGVGIGVVLLGVVVYLYSAYHALEAGGLSTSSERGACAEAATGRFEPGYRVAEQLVVHHGFFPPSAVCRWSGGTEAVLVAPTWTWAGLVLVALGLLGLGGAALAGRRRR